MGKEMVIQKGKGPPMWFKLYVIFGSFMGFFAFCGMGYVYTYGIENVCTDAHVYMSEEWVLENCPEPSIKSLAVVQIISPLFENSHFGFSAEVRSLFSLEEDEQEYRVFAFGCPHFNNDNRGLVYLAGVDDETLDITFSRILWKSTPDITAEDQHGFSIALSDSELFIGAPAIGSARPGVVTVTNPFATGEPCSSPLSSDFTCINSDSNSDTLPTSSLSSNGDNFGYTISLDTNSLTPATLVVTGVQESASGYATFYDISDALKPELISFQSSDPTSYYGFSSAIQDDIVVIGAPNTVDGSDLVGAVHVYSITTQTETDIIVGTGKIDEAFGYSVAVMGDTMVIGAPGRKCLTLDRLTHQTGYNGVDHNGKVYIYIFDGTNWVSTHTLSGSAADGSCFGASVDISDTELNIIVGAPFEGSEEEGAVYHFILDEFATTWELEENFPLEANDVVQAGPNAHYGHVVRMDAYDRAAVGLPGATGDDYLGIGKGTGWRFNYIDTAVIDSM